MLALIAKRALSPQHARDGLATVRAQHPELEEPVDVDSGTTIDAGDSAPFPSTPDEFHDALGSDVSAVRELLIEYEGKQDRFDAYQWYRVADLLRQVVQQWPDDGFTILDAVEPGHPDIVRAVIHGWNSAHLNAEEAGQVLRRIENLDLQPVLDAVTRMLAGYGAIEGVFTNWRALPGGRDLAISCWNAMSPGTPSALPDNDWMTQAFNHPAGHLAEFWVQAIETEWSANRDTWNGLPGHVAQHLETMLASNDIRSEMVQVVLASQLRFLHAADATWCERHLLPLLRWDDENRARRAWDGYLSHGTWSDQLLSAGLLHRLLETVRKRADFAEYRGRRLLAQLAEIAICADLDPGDWIRAFATQATLADRVEWAEQVAHVLREAPAEVVEQQWQRWMRSYWQGRLISVPTEMTSEEATAMAEWVLYLTDSQPEAIELALKHKAGLASHTLFLDEVRKDDRIARAPEQFAKLVAHLLEGTARLLEGTGTPFHEGYDLPDIVRKLKDFGASPESIRQVKEAAAGLQIPLDEN
jgi:Domain of unknown function (DUF4020)